MMPTVDKPKQKMRLIIFFLCLLNLIIFPTVVYAWSDPGLGPGVVQGTQVTITGGSDIKPGTYKYNTLYDVKVNGSQVGNAVLIHQIPSYGGYAFIPSSALSGAVSAFKGNFSHVSGNVTLYTINPNNNKRYWIREVGYHSGADVTYSGKVVNITPSPLPTGSISTPPTIKAGQPVNISLTAASLTLSGISVKYDKYKLDYKFKVNGSQVDSGTASKNLSKQVNYTFPSPGKYTLTLELTDAFKRVAPPITKVVDVEAAGPGPAPVPPSGGKPLADFDMPSMTKPNTSVTVTDRSQAYGGATITTRTWTITPSGYSGTPAGTSYSVSFLSEGTYTVKLVVKDSKGNTSDPCEKSIIVQGDFIPPTPPDPPNGPPVAKMKYPKTVGIGKPAQIENLSYDTDGTIVDVDWDINPQEGQKRSSIDDSGLSDNGGTVIFKEEGEYKITLTVEDDGGETASVSGTIDVINSPPKALISCPTDVMQGDDVVIKNRSYDPDGTIKNVVWTLEIPAGGVIKKSSDSSVVTQFTEDENRVYFDKEGTYKVTIEVTDDYGKKASTTETIVVKPAVPNAYFEPVGPYKQNRKLQFVAGGSSPSRYPIVTNLNQWVIEPVTSGLTADDIKIRLENPDNKGERVLLFKKPGQYRVKLKVTNTAGHTSEWYEKVYDIRPDEPPVAHFNVQSTYLRNPEDRNVSELLIRDLSYSPDGDVINKRVWKYKFDSDNDGSFDDETFIVFDAANNPSPVIRTSHVGKYLVELEVTEGFGEPTGTLTEFISPENYLKANTNSKPLQEKKTEVINVQPVVAFEVKKKKKADIVFTVDTINFNKLVNFDQKIKTILEPKLASYDIQVEIQTIDRKFTVLEVYPITPQFGKVAEKYGRGLINVVAISTDEFNAQQPNLDNYDMLLFGFGDCYGGKRLNSTMVNKVKAYIDSGGGVLFTHDTIWRPGNGFENFAPYLFKTDTNWSWVPSSLVLSSMAIKQKEGAITTYPYQIPDQIYLKSTHNQLYVPRDDTDVWFKLDKAADPRINFYVLTNKNVAMNCAGHTIPLYDAPEWEQKLFINTVYYTASFRVPPNSFKQALRAPKWRDDAMHFMIHMSDYELPEFNDPVQSAYIYSKLLADKINFCILGTTDNQSQANRIIATNDGNGTFIRNDNPNMEEAIKQISQYIINKVNTAMGGPTNYVLLNEEVEYKTYYNDYEKDPEIAQRWIYEHDPNFFENSLGKATFNGQWIGNPVYRFDKVGKYLTDFQKRDNPTTDDRFDEYRLWSFSALDKLSLYVHRRPIGTFTFQMTKQ